MSLKIIRCEQGSDEWYEARRGIVTASEFHTVMAKGKGGGESVTRGKYMRRLTAEILTGEVLPTYTNAHMERGKTMEDEARRHYAFMHDDYEIDRIGFALNTRLRAGCSPDALVNEDGSLEIKTCIPEILIEILEKGEVPPEHRKQIQGIIWILEREWIDPYIYWPKIKPFEQRVYRDEALIRQIADAVEEFNDELDRMVARVRRIGVDPAELRPPAQVTPVEETRREPDRF